MLSKLSLEVLGGGITLLDIGSSGEADPKWKPLAEKINLIGFDPNKEECLRMERLPHPFHSARYLPYALGGTVGNATLFHTSNKFCFSLLEPNSLWLDRFYFHDLFKIEGTSTVPTLRLIDVPEVQQLEVDAIKVDTQGLELPILKNAGSVLDQAIYVETETGFTENYQGETLFAEMNRFLRENHFLLFDFNDRHRIARNNVFKSHLTGREQPLWTEAVYIKDYVALAHLKSPLVESLTRAKALKVLLICAVQGCYDYGYECAQLFHKRGLVTDEELSELSKPKAWELPVSGFKHRVKGLIAFGVKMLPRRLKQMTYEVALYTADKCRTLQ